MGGILPLSAEDYPDPWGGIEGCQHRLHHIKPFNEVMQSLSKEFGLRWTAGQIPNKRSHTNHFHDLSQDNTNGRQPSKKPLNQAWNQQAPPTLSRVRIHV
jgi:hypothetical protein